MSRLIPECRARLFRRLLPTCRQAGRQAELFRTLPVAVNSATVFLVISPCPPRPSLPRRQTLPLIRTTCCKLIRIDAVVFSSFFFFYFLSRRSRRRNHNNSGTGRMGRFTVESSKSTLKHFLFQAANVGLLREN